MRTSAPGRTLSGMSRVCSRYVKILSAAVVLLAVGASSPARADVPLRGLWLDYEIGPAYIAQNDNRYGPTGTEFTADDVNQRDNLFVAQRLQLEGRLGERHGIILLYAPLDLVTRATLNRDIDFRGTVFREGTVVDSRYLFDGIRGSYLYRIIQRDRLEWDGGASLQVRNARVALANADGTQYAAEEDIGLVFALKTRLTWRTTSRLWASLEADGFSSFGVVPGVTGAIYDVALTLGIPLTRQSDDLSAFLRLRWVGGGADVERRDIENWGNFGFVLAGVRGDLQSLFLRSER